MTNAGGIGSVLEFLGEHQARARRAFPGVAVEKVLSFMGTTSAAGTHLDMGVARVLGIDVTDSGGELAIRLEGPLPRTPKIGECVTVSVNNLERFRGYQIKTAVLRSPAQVRSLFEETTPETTLVHGRHVYTVHHSPYVLNVFEQIPRDQVIEDVGRVKYAVVGVGEQANISPRFVFHHEERDGKVLLYHGDGYAHKTYLNVQKNRHETRVVVHPETYEGYRFHGVLEEIDLSSSGGVHEKVKRGFEAGGWGTPSRIFCLAASSWAPITA